MTLDHCAAIVADAVGLVTLLEFCVFLAWSALMWLVGRESRESVGQGA